MPLKGNSYYTTFCTKPTAVPQTTALEAIYQMKLHVGNYYMMQFCKAIPYPAKYHFSTSPSYPGSLLAAVSVLNANDCMGYSCSARCIAFLSLSAICAHSPADPHFIAAVTQTKQIDSRSALGKHMASSSEIAYLCSQGHSGCPCPSMLLQLEVHARSKRPLSVCWCLSPMLLLPLPCRCSSAYCICDHKGTVQV